MSKVVHLAGRDPDVLAKEAEAAVSSGALCAFMNLETPVTEGCPALSAVKEVFPLPVYVRLIDVSHFDDLKFLLYAGAEGVVLPETAAESEAVRNAAERFGKERFLFTDEEKEAEELLLARCSVRPRITFSELKKNADGLVPVITEDEDGRVLMLAYMDEDAFDHTIDTRRMTYYSRSRKERWVKGETSGHYQYLISLTADCDKDTLLARVHQVGAACHTGSRSCFFNTVVPKTEHTVPTMEIGGILTEVAGTVADRKKHPKEGSYTNYLLEKGLDKILKKVGEENTELIIAAKNQDPKESVYEIADYLYHLMVLMEVKGISWNEIAEALSGRH